MKKKTPIIVSGDDPRETLSRIQELHPGAEVRLEGHIRCGEAPTRPIISVDGLLVDARDPSQLTDVSVTAFTNLMGNAFHKHSC